jgi:branched-chain amino acid transport system substrate-binding protein
LRLLDDQSESASSGRLYEQLIDDKADVLMGPLGSAASMGAAGAAERNRHVLINATGNSRSSQRPGYRYVFQIAAPLASYASGAFELARGLGVKRVTLLARDDPTSRELGSRARELALKLGLVPGEVEIYAPDSDDFAPQAKKAQVAGSQAWIAFGLPQDAAEMVKSLKKLRFAPRLFVAQGATEPDFVKRVGQDAEYAIGILPYDRRSALPANRRFAEAFAKRWSAEPSQVAAEGYAAAKVLEEGVRRAGALEPLKLREALSALELDTPLGRYKVDADGVQQGVPALLTQIQRGRRVVVWPEPLATAKPLLPYPAWEERKPIK